MSYYRHRQMAYLDLAKFINNARTEKLKEIEIAPILIALTARYEIGESAIIKRLELMQSVDKDFTLLKDRLVFD